MPACGHDIYKEKQASLEEKVQCIETEATEDHKFRPLSQDDTKARARVLRPVFGYDPTDDKATLRTDKKKDPLAQLLSGKDLTVTTIDDSNGRITIKRAAVKPLQNSAEIYFCGEKISLATHPGACQLLRHIHLLKAGKRIPDEELPRTACGEKRFKTLHHYKNCLEEINYYFLIRFESIMFYTANHKLIPEGRKVIAYESSWPKLAHTRRGKGYQSHAYRNFTTAPSANSSQNRTLTHNALEKLKEIYKKKFLDELTVTAQYGELYSAVFPNAFVAALTDKEQERVKECYLDALLSALEEIKQAIIQDGEKSAYIAFQGVLLCPPSQEFHNKIERARKDRGSLILSNQYSSYVLDELTQGTIKTAQPTMSEPFSPIGNAALGNRAGRAKDEAEMRNSYGMHAIVGNPCQSASNIDHLSALKFDQAFSDYFSEF